jgi:hypothetical protein
METVRDLILLAGKKWRVFASGETPSADEIADGLQSLQSLVDEIYVGWTDVDKDAVYEAREDERISTTSTVTLPTLVDDGGERRPRSGAKVMVITSGVPVLSVYRGDKAGWVTASSLTLDSEIPFDAQLHNTAADALAGRYCETFGEPTSRQLRMGQRALGILSLATRKQTGETYY